MAFDVTAAERLRALLHQSSRSFGKEASFWTLEVAAEVSFEQGLTPKRVRREAVRTALQRLGVRWRWAMSYNVGVAKSATMTEVQQEDHMMEREQALAILRSHKQELAAKYGVERLGIFGSIAEIRPRRAATSTSSWRCRRTCFRWST